MTNGLLLDILLNQMVIMAALSVAVPNPMKEELLKQIEHTKGIIEVAEKVVR